tara:strand:+ start:2866 stop:5754 length:2889 start_codon:yes stop_codon:yes gene_type:complete
MNTSELRNNQKKAIECSVNNNFKSGVHFHATGTGKSWIALELIYEYNKRYNNNVIWLCEQKSILIDQFQKEVLKEKGYDTLFKRFLVINYTESKPTNWYEKINSATYWKKPILLIINRQFLVSQKKYEKIKMDIGLIIHDECHSIQNNTTKEFYDFILSKKSIPSCLGFSATPNLNHKPYDNIISEYTIFDAFCDNTIVPPKIKWVESDNILNDKDMLEICKENIMNLHYKKVIIWCGIIEKCNELAILWKKYFSNFNIYMDTSLNSNDDYDKYLLEEKNAVLFCAAKHREGSDIKNLDACIFLDKVENRNSKTFIQCIGRVLRKDKQLHKKYGLILDLKASSCIKICDRMNEYLNASNNFPWDYSYEEKNVNNKSFIEHELLLKNEKVISKKLQSFTIEDIVERFVKICPEKQVYQERLKFELDMIKAKHLESYLIRAVEILEITDFIPHVTRGSCGSSLVCYLLGISNVDPVKYNICFSRFLNVFRSSLPDIDFDFPHYLRDEVFLKLELQWPNQVARISNHVHWHEKSALREALRKIGIRKRISKENIQSFIKNLPSEEQCLINKYQSELNNTFRHYSLHCGGIIFFHDGVPKELLLNKKTLSQITYDKREVSERNNFKIDILSSRGISQLINIVGKNIDFSDCPFDEETYDMLQKGNNLGITLAESPLMRKALLSIKPKSITDLAICLAIIRPAAKDTRKEVNEIDYTTKFVFDDDAITLLMNNLHIDEGLADKYRRCICKNKWQDEDLEYYNSLVDKLSPEKKLELLDQVKNLRFYSFCKSHSYSYAQLVYKLAYQKRHFPKKFWNSTIRNVCSSYRKWVHLYEACTNGVNIDKFLNKQSDCSIYAESRKKKFNNLNYHEQMIKYGYWNMKKGEFFPNCYFYKKKDEYLFSGLIANLRVLSSKPNVYVCFICVDTSKYIEVIIKNKYIKSNNYGVKGRATIKSQEENSYNAHIAVFY